MSLDFSSQVIFLYFHQCWIFQPHPSCGAALVSCPQVAEATFVVGGVRSVEHGRPRGKRDGHTWHNTGHWRLVQFFWEK